MNRIMLPLLLGLSLAPVVCCAGELDDQTKAIAEIEKLGGTVNRDAKSPGKAVSEAPLRASTAPRSSERRAEPVNALTGLRELLLTNAEFTESRLEHLKGMTQFGCVLHLYNTKVRGPRAAVPPGPGEPQSSGSP